MRTPIYTSDTPGDQECLAPVPSRGEALPVLRATSSRTSQDPVALYLSRLSVGSRRVMTSALDTVARLLSGGVADARELPWQEVRYQHAQAVRAALVATISAKTGKNLSASTINRSLAATRGVLRECWRLGLISAEELARATDIERAPGNSLPSGRSLDVGEITALFAACQRDTTPAGARDAALLALGYAGGLRRAEICNIDVDHYTPESGRLEIHGGKGNKNRVVFIRNGAADAVAAWLAFRGTEPGPLLFPVAKNGKIESRRLTGDTVYRVTKKRGDEAGIKPFGPHDLRRSCLSEMLDRGVDLATARAWAGHSSGDTTLRYDRRGERALEGAATTLAVPYRFSGTTSGG
jgi:integrase/recombinase XerD